jgi:hypothetical protein
MSLRILMTKMSKKEAEKIPAGFKTCRQWAKAEQLSESRTLKILRALIATTPPMVERRDFLILDNGVLRKAPHYRKLQ